LWSSYAYLLFRGVLPSTMGKDSKKKHSKDKDSSEKSRKEHKHKSKDHDRERKSSSKDNDSKADHSNIKPITSDDFFTKSEEFRVWLKLSENVFFEDLTSKEARKMFDKEFVKDYNKGKLTSMYYDGKNVMCGVVSLAYDALR